MKKYLAFAVMSLLSLSCSAGSAGNESVKVAKSNGAKQCESGYTTMTTMRRELTENGVTVISGACGNDGLARITMCGADAGEINIFTIPLADQDQAEALGFSPLSNWPDAVEVPCRNEAPSRSAVQVYISGIGPAVDSAAYSKVRLVIGNAVARGILDKFIVQGYGIEGGFTACVEASRSATPKRFDGFVKQLRSIRTNPATTAYSVTPVESCS